MVGRSLIIVASRKMVNHGLANVESREVVARHSSISATDWSDTGRLEARQDSIDLLGSPFLSDASSEMVHVHVQVAIELSQDIDDVGILASLADAAVKEGLVVLDVIVRDIDTLVLRAMIVDQAVCIQMPVVQACFHGCDLQVELLEHSFLASVAAIVASVPWEIHDHTSKIDAPGHPEHLETIVRGHDALKSDVVGHGDQFPVPFHCSNTFSIRSKNRH